LTDASIRVLLVEDNPGDARLIREMLREGDPHRWQIQHVERLEAALERISQGSPDVVLLDLSLPDTQGLETFSRVHEAAPDVPVVVLTGLADEETARRAVQEGAQDYLPKGEVNAHGLVRSLLYALERARALNAMRELERLREEWTTVIAHDLRQPVAAISFYAQALAATAAADPALERIQPRTQSIISSTQRLDRMISDLLDVSRLGAGRLTLQPVNVDLAALLHRVVGQFSRDGELSVEVSINDDSAMVRADPGRLEQILDNLLSNALKYRAPDTPILVDASRRDGAIEVAVTNTGAGISAEDIPALFTRFYRTDSARAGTVPGLGLGLYITQELVRAHGGRVWVQSVPGEKTSFHFTLPVAGKA
jgi:signal transduction histidine kinase